MTDESRQNDEIAEQLRYQEFGVLNAQLSPCPFCSGVPAISFCEWDCCGASARYIECDCGISTSADIEKWNNRTSEYWKYLKNGEIEYVTIEN